MNILKIELVENESIVNEKQMPYSGENGFFIALVSICDELEVDVPIWTTHEERILERNGYIMIPMSNGQSLVISQRSL